MLSCAAAAVAASAAAPREASAQTAPTGAFQGSISSTVGTVTRTPTSNTAETITVGSSTATINWSPFDSQGTGNIDFLPQGNVATFVNGASISDYTVLNRIVPTDATRTIELNGSVLAKLQDGAVTGGKVWFYSPGGILVGANALFDVGGLLLTTLDPVSWDSTSGSFSAATTAPGSVRISSGAQINATPENSYVAMIAPRVEQGGTVRVNGSTAYIAADAVTMSINQGLFNIQVATGGGTSDANGVVHTGTTGGPSSTGTGDNHAIYMVAVPKNQAMTMLLRGNMGFDAASSATIENGAIYLSAGAIGGTIFHTNPIGSRMMVQQAGPLPDANILFQPVTVSSVVEGQAARNFELSSLAGTTSTLLETVSFFGAGKAEVVSNAGSVDLRKNLLLYSHADGTRGLTRIATGPGGSITVGGSAQLYAGVPLGRGWWSAWNIESGTARVEANGGSISIGSLVMEARDHGPVGTNLSGGTAELRATGGGQVTIAGGATLNTNATAFAGGTSTGGSSTVWVDNGTIAVGGNLGLLASANNSGTSPSGGSPAVGGTARIAMGASGGTLTVAGTANLNAGANGASGDPQLGGAGGSAAGGTAVVNIAPASSGTATFGALSLFANATGGNGTSGSQTIGSGGNATAGNAHLIVNRGTVTVTGTTTIHANAYGGSGSAGGNAFGGLAGTTTNAGSLALGPSISIYAQGMGGNASLGFGGSGGIGEGGVAFVEARAANGVSSAISGGNATIDASGFGGRGGAGNGSTIAAGAGGAGRGGLYTGQLGTGGAFAASSGNGASLILGTTVLLAPGHGGEGGIGGAGQSGGTGGAAEGGTAQAGNYGSQGSTATSTYGDLSLNAAAYGGQGGAGPAGQGNGGSARGGGSLGGVAGDSWGGAYVSANGTTTIASLNMHAQGYGGIGSIGGQALGGIVQLASFKGLLDVNGNVWASTSAYGGIGSVTGGAGTGGVSIAGALDGAGIDVSGDLRVLADGYGSQGSLTGGLGTGGSVSLEAYGSGSVAAGTIDAAALGVGGQSASGQAGNGRGGKTEMLLVQGGRFTSGNDIYLRAYGSGGTGATGGHAFGGTTRIDSDGGTISAVDQVVVDAVAYGGVGTVNASGNATGGTAEIKQRGGSLTFGSLLNAAAFGHGQSGVTAGGNGTGGNATITVEGGAISGSGQTIIGVGGIGGSASAAGGAGGQAVGGNGTLAVTGGGSFATGGNLNFNTSGTGGAALLGQGGTASGGTALMSLNGGSISAGSLGQFANATGGQGLVAGDGGGGSVHIGLSQAADRLTVTGSASAQASGTGGAGAASGGTGGTGGNGTGGTVTIDVAAGEANLNTLFVTANGVGGAGGASTGGTGGDGGDGLGGYVSLSVAGTLQASSFQEFARSFGGAGGTGASGQGLGGLAQSGDAYLFVAQGGSASFTQGAIVNSSAFAGAGSTGGDAFGGYSEVMVEGSLTSGRDLQVTAQGFGGEGTGGAGGTGHGGTSYLDLFGGSLSLTQGLAILNAGVGGNGTTVGGDAYGGASYFDISNGGTANLGTASTLTATATGGSGVTAGGNAYGGWVGLSLLDGVVDLGGAELNADAFGGAASNGSGGEAFAGFAQIMSEGRFTATGELFVSAEGEGGDGTDSGGAGYGGDAAILGLGSSVIKLGTTTTVGADGTGGLATTGTGGAGFGGSARLSAFDASSISGNDVSVTSDGDGGSGTNGGVGYGGYSDGETVGGSLIEASGTGARLVLTGETIVASRGLGGNASGSGTAGSGFGGDATLRAVSGTASASLAKVWSHGAAGTGGSTAGIGSGGISTTLASGGTLSVGSLEIIADGSAEGGEIRVAAELGDGSAALLDLGAVNARANGQQMAGSIELAAGTGTIVNLGAAVVEATGAAGTGDVVVAAGTQVLEGHAAAALNAASLQITTSGTVGLATYAGGRIDVAGALSATAGGLIALSNDGGLGGLIQASGAYLDGAAVDLLGDLDAAIVALTADGDIAIDELLAADSLTITAGGKLTAGTLSSGGSLALNAGTDLSVGNLSALGDLTLVAGGGLTALDLVAGGDLDLVSGGAMAVGTLTAGGAVDLESAGSIAFGDVSARQLDFDAVGAVSGGNVDVGGAANGEARGAIVLGNVRAGGAGVEAGDFAVGLLSETSIRVGNVQSADRVGFATVGNLTTGTIRGGSLVMALAGGDVSLGAITTAADGRVYLADDSMFFAARDAAGEFDSARVLGAAPVASGGAITINGPVATGVFQAAAGTSLTLGDVIAGTSIDLAAGGVANLAGLVAAPTISLSSGDLNLTGQLGKAGVTQMLRMTAVSGSDVILGGSASQSPAAAGSSRPYHLSQAEADSIESAGIVFTAAGPGSAAAPNVVVRSLVIGGSQTDGGGTSSVVLNTGGDVIVEGALRYVNAGGSDRLTINAGDDIQVIAGAGSIRMTDGAGKLAGTLALNASDVWVADSQLMEKLRADPNFAGRDAALASNSGTATPDGHVGAGTMNVATGNSLFVQNSGTRNDPGGLTVGDGGLTVTSTGSQPATVVAFGRQQRSDGSTASGDAFYKTVTFEDGQGGFGQSSSVNGCAVDAGCPPPSDPAVSGPESILGPVGLMSSPVESAGSEGGAGGSESGSEESEKSEDEAEDEGSVGVAVSLGLISTGGLTTDQLIDDPVTSGSDSGQWGGELDVEPIEE